jgi:hypothetical protein
MIYRITNYKVPEICKPFKKPCEFASWHCKKFSCGIETIWAKAEKRKAKELKVCPFEE